MFWVKRWNQYEIWLSKLNQRFKYLHFSTFNRYKRNEKRTIENKNFLKKVNCQYYIFRNEKKAEKSKIRKKWMIFNFQFVFENRKTQKFWFCIFNLKSKIDWREGTRIIRVIHFFAKLKNEKWKEWAQFHFLTSLENEKRISCNSFFNFHFFLKLEKWKMKNKLNSVWFIFQFSFFLENWKMKNELRFCLIFYFSWKKMVNEK